MTRLKVHVVPRPYSHLTLACAHAKRHRIASFPVGRYCQIKFYDESKKKTKTIKKTLEPEWNEPEVYNWKGSIASLLERIYAKIDVYDKDMLRDDFMGRTYLQ